jgi:quaternary ammonium compound-resistance protein SugE
MAADRPRCRREWALGTAYAAWTGIGALGTVIAGMLVFDESTAVACLACMGLIAAGIVRLKLLPGA